MQSIGSEIRIPTILGLGVLLIGVVAGVFLVLQNQNIKIQAAQSFQPQNITVTNVSAASASIFWQTDKKTTGFVAAGTSSSLELTFNDERDLDSPQAYYLHFVTLNNLKPNTIYLYKITSGPTIYPAQQPLTFTTPSSLERLDQPPLIGTVIDENLQPVEESLVVLETEGAQTLSTITKAAGNFIIPLAEIKTSNLDQNFNIQISSPSATLTIFNNTLRSRVSLKLPFANQVLPPLTLGKDAQITPPPQPITKKEAQYDLNKDGVVNAADYGIVVENLGKKPRNQEADFNKDGVVDKVDLNLINKMISENANQP